MQTEIENKLTLAEIGNLWVDYMNNSAALCVLKYFNEKAVEKDIKSLLKFALDLSEKRVNNIKNIYKQENLPVPVGFTDTDVDITAPRLFSDSFFLLYAQNLSKIGMVNYVNFLSLISRADIRNFFMKALDSAVELNDKASSLMMSKELFVKAPSAPISEQIDYVGKKDFIKDMIGDKRPLTAIEVSNIFSNIQTNVVGKAFVTGFSQVAKSMQIKQYFLNGIEMSSDHIDTFAKILREDGLSASTTWDVAVMNITVAPFSEKLMLFHLVTINANGISSYGTSLAASLRRDLQTLYTRLGAKIGKYAQDGIDIIIENGWFEQPPQIAKNNELVKV
jgi:hypothetical protein